jgi:hypothetical protein
VKLQRKYKPQVERALRDQLNKFIENYPNNTTQLWDENLLSVLSKMYRETSITFANLQYKNLQKVALKNTMGKNAEWTQEINEWLSRHGLQLVTTITNSQRERIYEIINRVINEGVEEGYGAEQVTNMILLELREFGRIGVGFVAERIVRTETMRAANMGHIQGARAHKFEVRKEWISALDNRTRRFERDDYDHWILDGQQREIDEPFIQNGKKGIAVAQQPGDINAPAGFTINCRCTIAFEAKRDKNGRIIRKV